jgi:hypothetical protein
MVFDWDQLRSFAVDDGGGDLALFNLTTEES